MKFHFPLTALLFLLSANTVSAQIIWNEDFVGYANCSTTGANNNTANPANDWTSSYTDCDDGATTCTSSQSFWGTQSSTNNFRVNDIEGGACCGTGGTAQNYLTTETINISAYASVLLNVTITKSGTFEAGTLGTCDNSGDIVQITYSLNGGAFIQFGTNGFLTGNFTSPSTASSCVSGTTIAIRIQAGNKANDENIFIDDIIVNAVSCTLPAELSGYYITCENDGFIKACWTTASETNNSHFTLQGSVDGLSFMGLTSVQGQGNSNSPTEYNTTYKNIDNYKYFRLVQTDFDGRSINHAAIYADCSKEQGGLSVFANENKLTISMAKDLPGKTEFSLYEITGKLLTVQSTVGYENNAPVFMDISSYPNCGIYIVSAVNQVTGEKFYSKVHF
ncbi:MAG TPA: hypothetical protein VD905_06870 [Flavobacteriales bacterium]|nr:hypothetical protein [Flavobacteriales bacterium]